MTCECLVLLVYRDNLEIQTKQTVSRIAELFSLCIYCGSCLVMLQALLIQSSINTTALNPLELEGRREKKFEQFLDGEFVQYEPMQVYKRDQMKYLSRVLRLSEKTHGPLFLIF